MTDSLLAQVFAEISEQLRLRCAQVPLEEKADKGWCAHRAKAAAWQGDFIGALLYGALAK